MRAIQAAKIKIPNEPKIIPKRAHFLFFTFRTLKTPINKAINETTDPTNTAKVPLLIEPNKIIVPKPTIPNIPEALAIFWCFGSFSLITESFLTNCS